MFTSNYGTGSPSFYCLGNLEFNSLLYLGHWFNYLLLLCLLVQKFEAELRKSKGKSGITLSLFDRNLKQLDVEDVSFGLHCSSTCAQYLILSRREF